MSATESSLQKHAIALTVATLLGASLTQTALAQDGRLYAGLQAGKSLIDTNKDIFDLGNDTNYQVFGGWKFTDWIGVEAGYADLGDFKGQYFDDIGGHDITLNIKATTLGVSLWGSFSWGIDVFAKLGGYYAVTTAKDTGASEYDENAWGVFYEAGLLYPFNDNVGVTLSWQNFQRIEILNQGTYAGVDKIDLGVVVQF